ncbi:MAG: sulfotransferase domain-containing protein [Pseudomonadota bacterium]
MSNNIYLHLGAHKTASTYMQRFFKANERLFKRRDVELVFKKKLMRNGMGKLFRWHYKVSRGRNAAFPQAFKSYLESLGDSKSESIFISYEGLLGRMDLSKTKTIYPSCHLSVNHLADSFSNKNVKVVFCIRNYADFIESSYKWLVGSGRSLSFDEYIREVDLEKISWLPIIEALIETFGKNNVVFWRYEDYKANYKVINHKLLNFFFSDVNEDEISYKWDEPTNVSLSEKRLRWVLALNKYIDSLPFWGLKRKQKIKRSIGASVNKTSFIDKRSGKPRLLGNDVRRKLSSRYTEDVKSLIDHGYCFLIDPGK